MKFENESSINVLDVLKVITTLLTLRCWNKKLHPKEIIQMEQVVWTSAKWCQHLCLWNSTLEGPLLSLDGLRNLLMRKIVLSFYKIWSTLEWEYDLVTWVINAIKTINITGHSTFIPSLPPPEIAKNHNILYLYVQMGKHVIPDQLFKAMFDKKREVL